MEHLRYDQGLVTRRLPSAADRPSYHEPQRKLSLISLLVFRLFIELVQPQNYFADIEQAAFSPSTMVPGVAASADPGKPEISTNIYQKIQRS